VHPRFAELVGYARHQGISWISVTTNGTLPREFYKSLPVDQYVFSIHFEFDWQRVKLTLENLFLTTKLHLIGQLMAHHDHMPNVKKVYDRFEFAKLPCTVRRIRWTEDDHNLFDDMRYNLDDLEWIIEKNSTVKANCVIDDDPTKLYHANDIIKLHLNEYRGWTCNAGIESLMINWDGDVHRATCRVGGSLGNIYTGTFAVPANPVVCTRDNCTCAADIPLTKYAPAQEKSS
jgi:MoaA/NifB/PqqE/SkfB family radical SAM enzyme